MLNDPVSELWGFTIRCDSRKVLLVFSEVVSKCSRILVTFSKSTLQEKRLLQWCSSGLDTSTKLLRAWYEYQFFLGMIWLELLSHPKNYEAKNRYLSLLPCAFFLRFPFFFMFHGANELRKLWTTASMLRRLICERMCSLKRWLRENAFFIVSWRYTNADLKILTASKLLIEVRLASKVLTILHA